MKSTTLILLIGMLFWYEQKMALAMLDDTKDGCERRIAARHIKRELKVNAKLVQRPQTQPDLDVSE